ncbi:hypothetical protein B_008 [Cronobacter phage vB_CsaM_leB]|uniref:Uncharacterized protein n=1 Tax=Cronobacter phage vB_CsaM_leB TaxID=1885242 RepID=A0A1W5N036_9CAUD|nr:hypothetical protein HWB00_gp008 [Cronobacter phage vB_CsaM_leB]AOG16134.1 hypothetical protein B_008 [Cronobacter phage vB_CsaM_leB]
MLVYRVELKASILSKYDGWCNQLGPYTGCVGDEDDLYEYLDIHGIEFGLNFGVSETRHPAPCEDLRLMRNLKKHGKNYRSYIFGFSSLQKLSKWFDSWERQILENQGYICMVYETDLMFAGNKQCVFSKAATPIRFIPLSEIY